VCHALKSGASVASKCPEATPAAEDEPSVAHAAVHLFVRHVPRDIAEGLPAERAARRKIAETQITGRPCTDTVKRSAPTVG